MTETIIIGGGLGGLFVGALLAKENHKVTIVEKNPTIGGGLQSFRRFGEWFDTGMHIIGGMQDGGNMRKICNYLGIIDKVEIKHVDDICDSLYFAEDGQWYHIRKTRQGFIDSLANYFPDQRANLTAYVDAIYEMVDSMTLFNLEPTTHFLHSSSPSFVIAANEFIAKYISNEKLRSVLAYMNPLYGGKGGVTPAYIHAVINVLYINGGSRFIDASAKFADLLADVVKDHGGNIITNDGVEAIEVAGKEITGIRTRSGRQLTGDYYISAIHPCELLRITPESAFSKAFRNRMESIPNSYSAFSLYIKLKPNSFRYINRSEYYMSRYDEIWNFDKSHAFWPLGFLFMTPPRSDQSEYASTALITAPMLFDEVAQWEHTSVGRRGKDYEEWKQKQAELLIGRIEEMHPGFRDCIEKTNTASPLTIRDFYASKDGCLSGFSKDCNNLMLTQLPVATKLKNLFLTGQNNNLHGFYGVALTAINTCEAIVGLNNIITRINPCDNSLQS